MEDRVASVVQGRPRSDWILLSLGILWITALSSGLVFGCKRLKQQARQHPSNTYLLLGCCFLALIPGRLLFILDHFKAYPSYTTQIRWMSNIFMFVIWLTYESLFIDRYFYMYYRTECRLSSLIPLHSHANHRWRHRLWSWITSIFRWILSVLSIAFVLLYIVSQVFALAKNKKLPPVVPLCMCPGQIRLLGLGEVVIVVWGTVAIVLCVTFAFRTPGISRYFLVKKEMTHLIYLHAMYLIGTIATLYLAENVASDTSELLINLFFIPVYAVLSVYISTYYSYQNAKRLLMWKQFLRREWHPPVLDEENRSKATPSIRSDRWRSISTWTNAESDVSTSLDSSSHEVKSSSSASSLTPKGHGQQWESRSEEDLQSFDSSSQHVTVCTNGILLTRNGRDHCSAALDIVMDDCLLSPNTYSFSVPTDNV